MNIWNTLESGFDYIQGMHNACYIGGCEGSNSTFDRVDCLLVRVHDGHRVNIPNINTINIITSY